MQHNEIKDAISLINPLITTRKPFEFAYKDDDGNLYVEVGETRFTFVPADKKSTRKEALRISSGKDFIEIHIERDQFLTLVGELSLLWKAIKNIDENPTD